MNKFIRCPICRGRKQMYGAGMIYKSCERCGGVGYVEKEIIEESVTDELSKNENDGEQNKIESTENAISEKEVDSSEKISSKRDRKVQGKKDSVGISESHLPERSESEKDDKTEGCKESENQQSGSEL